MKGGTKRPWRKAGKGGAERRRRRLPPWESVPARPGHRVGLLAGVQARVLGRGPAGRSQVTAGAACGQQSNHPFMLRFQQGSANLSDMFSNKQLLK